MPGLLPEVDPHGLLEYSVVYTDRAINHMSGVFQSVMTDLSATLKRVYNADAVSIVPGSGTFGMEAVARQFATGKKCLVIRNGFFSFRWSQIFEMGDIPSSSTVLKARKTGTGSQDPFAPAPIDEVIQTIADEKPDVVFAPHVETSSGMLLPDDYLRQVAEAVHAHGGMLVLDCAAFVMLNEVARDAALAGDTTSFSCDLGKWLQIMQAYENGGHAYHATMPTDALAVCRNVMRETEAYGFAKVRAEQQELGDRVRALLAERGIQSVAAPGFEAPGVVVCYTDDPEISTGEKFVAQGMQIAAGVPLQCDEPDNFRTFRLGLFGLDKLHNIDRTVVVLDRALSEIL